MSNFDSQFSYTVRLSFGKFYQSGWSVQIVENLQLTFDTTERIRGSFTLLKMKVKLLIEALWSSYITTDK